MSPHRGGCILVVMTSETIPATRTVDRTTDLLVLRAKLDPRYPTPTRRRTHRSPAPNQLTDKRPFFVVLCSFFQGLCGTIVSEQRFPDFNPGTLNYRMRQHELLRIDKDNLALMNRLKGVSSGYNKELVKPKYFQQPHMGLFPR